MEVSRGLLCDPSEGTGTVVQMMPWTKIVQSVYVCVCVRAYVRVCVRACVREGWGMTVTNITVSNVK